MILFWGKRLWAVNFSNTYTVKLLLGGGDDVNVRDKYDGKTALIKAAYRGYTDIVKLLLAARADVSAWDKDGRPALIYVTQKGHTEIVDLLKDAAVRE